MRIKKVTISLLRRVKRKILSKPKSFDMDSWASPDSNVECGTTGCIAGWVVMLTHPDVQEQVKHYDDGLVEWENRAIKELRISQTQAHSLFHDEDWPERYKEKFYDAFSAKERARVAANRIEHFIRTGK